VQRDIYDNFVADLTSASERMTLGDPLDPKTRLGPVVSREQFDKVKGYLEVGQQEGARITIGGGTGEGKGYFIKPTIFADVTNNMKISREEIFGPVAAAIPFKDETDAVFQGNDTTYGLAAAVWTRDISRAHRVARALKAGTV
jgi:acyl-CoA reductase-like NAD-dependent aldehyde dehydrogenase